MLFNGINVAINKPDLLDRSLIIQIERIADDKRRDEREIAQEFENVRSGLLGAIFDRLSVAIRDYATVKPARLPRMADFAKWAIAATGNADQFLSDFAANVERQNSEAIDTSVVATTLLALLDDSDAWDGTPQDLYAALKAKADDLKIPPKSFAGSVAAMGRKLREIRPNLIALGWIIDFSKSGTRTITINRTKPENGVSTVHAVQSSDGTDSKNGSDGIFPTYSSPSQPDPWGVGK